MLKKLNTSALLLSSAIAMSAPTMAYEAGDILLRVGTATVAPESKSDDLKGIAGEAVSANDNTQVGISGTYMLTSNIGIEVLGATPFTHDIKAKGGTLNGTPIAEVKHLPPTVSAQYYFMDNTSALQPYVGAGLNVTVFFDENLTTEMKGAGYEKVSLDSSVGLAVQAGVDYSFNENMFVNASAMYAQIGTTATIDDTSGNDGAFGSQVVVDYDLDPMVYRVNFGYKF
jgi:outer membrane protein